MVQPAPRPTDPAVKPAPQPRRNFLAKTGAVVIGGIVGIFPFLTGLVVFSDPLRRKSAAGKWFLAGTLEALQAGVPLRVTLFDNRRDAWSEYRDEPIGAVFLVAGQGKTAVTAFNTTCPHAGCSVGFQPARDCFVCPCHTSAFDLSGKPISPVPPRGMDTLECEIRNSGEIWVKYQDFLTGKSEKIAKA
jgi:menaquinol-cytochrome c reductase iron-sulfur subunit